MPRRFLLLLAAVMLCLVPATGAPGGGNDSGVWILPRASFLTSQVPSSITGYSTSNLTNASPRDRLLVTDLATPLTMRVSDDMTVPPSAAVYDVDTNRQLSVQVVGGEVTLPGRTLRALATLPGGVGAGVITDTMGRGYLIATRYDATSHGVVIEIY